MHVLHHPHHLRRTILAALAAATLAIGLTLAIAPGLNDLNSSQAPAGAPVAQTAVATPAISLPSADPFAHGGFTGPFTTPLRLPWASTAG